MEDVITSLTGFIEIAQHNRKFTASTATGYKIPLKLAAAELTEQERNSLDTFVENLEQIFQNIYSKNKIFSAETIETYKQRLRRLINYYQLYGTDSAKMASWKVSVKPLKKIQQKLIVPSTNTEPNSDSIPEDRELELKVVQNREIQSSTNTTRFEIPLSLGLKAIILTPTNITEEDVNKIKNYVTFLESTVEKQ